MRRLLTTKPDDPCAVSWCHMRAGDTVHQWTATPNEYTHPHKPVSIGRLIRWRTQPLRQRLTEWIGQE